MKALRVSHYGPTPQNPSLGRQFDQLWEFVLDLWDSYEGRLAA